MFYLNYSFCYYRWVSHIIPPLLYFSGREGEREAEAETAKALLIKLVNERFPSHSVVGWNSTIGAWTRLEGTPCDPNPNKPFAKMDNVPLFNTEGKMNPSITILGK